MAPGAAQPLPYLEEVRTMRNENERKGTDENGGMAAKLAELADAGRRSKGPSMCIVATGWEAAAATLSWVRMAADPGTTFKGHIALAGHPGEPKICDLDGADAFMDEWEAIDEAHGALWPYVGGDDLPRPQLRLVAIGPLSATPPEDWREEADLHAAEIEDRLVRMTQDRDNLLTGAAQLQDQIAQLVEAAKVADAAGWREKYEHAAQDVARLRAENNELNEECNRLHSIVYPTPVTDDEQPGDES